MPSHLRASTTRTVITAAVAISTALTVGVAWSSPAAAGTTRRSLPNTAARWAGQASSQGRAGQRDAVDLRVYLAPHGGVAALQQAASAVSTPGSGQYRHFLTAAQFHQSFDATDTEVSAVSDWLDGAGLQVSGVEAHHRYLTVRGTVAQAEQAFGVTLRRYRHNGEDVRANDTPVSVPTAIAGYVSTVTGLDTTPHRVAPDHIVADAPPAAGFRNARPCSATYGQVSADLQADFKTPLPKFKGKTLPYAVCGYTGPQLRAAYEGSTALSGAGVTVAITDAYASPTIVSDIRTYAKRHGDGGYAQGQFTQVKPGSYTNQKDCDPSGWYGEETLDIEAVHAMAPAANIRYYASKSCFDADFLTTLATVVDEDQASFVSNSWSDLEAAETSANVAAYEEVFLQGAMQGIGFMFSSGDSGDELANTSLRQVDYPASDPYVTAVGGTADAIDATGNHRFQTGWGTNKWALSADQKTWTSLGFLYGAGGGTSTLFGRPAYQDGVVPASYGSGRAVPDVGLDADPNTGMLIGITQTFPEGVSYGEFRIGGTSLASPLYAGLAALASEHSGSRIGFLNPVIYAQAGTDVLTDIAGPRPDAGNVRVDFVNGVDNADGLTYSVRTFNTDSSLKVRKGWDDVTGLGSPNAAWLTSVPPKD